MTRTLACDLYMYLEEECCISHCLLYAPLYNDAFDSQSLVLPIDAVVCLELGSELCSNGLESRWSIINLLLHHPGIDLKCQLALHS